MTSLHLLHQPSCAFGQIGAAGEAARAGGSVNAGEQIFGHADVDALDHGRTLDLDMGQQDEALRIDIRAGDAALRCGHRVAEVKADLQMAGQGFRRIGEGLVEAVANGNAAWNMREADAEGAVRGVLVHDGDVLGLHGLLSCLKVRQAGHPGLGARLPEADTALLFNVGERSFRDVRLGVGDGDRPGPGVVAEVVMGAFDANLSPTCRLDLPDDFAASHLALSVSMCILYTRFPGRASGKCVYDTQKSGAEICEVAA